MVKKLPLSTSSLSIKRKLFFWGGGVLGVLVSGIILSSSVVSLQYVWHIYKNINTLPYTPVGLVLGTSRYLEGGENIFYTERIRMAAELYKARKIDCLLLSGDNTSKSYNEPIEMQKSLLWLGIPAERMYLDYAGVRTLDSVLRARDVFRLSTFTIISQPFHAERALYLARANDIEAQAFWDVSISFWTAPRVYIREIGARILAVKDVFSQKDARFAGEPIEINYDPDLRPLPSKTCAPRDL